MLNPPTMMTEFAPAQQLLARRSLGWRSRVRSAGPLFEPNAADRFTDTCREVLFAM